MNSNTTKVTPLGEGSEFQNFKVKTEKRLDLISEWIDHIRFAQACPLPRSPIEIEDRDMALDDELEQLSPNSKTFLSTQAKLSALRWVMGEAWD